MFPGDSAPEGGSGTPAETPPAAPAATPPSTPPEAPGGSVTPPPAAPAPETHGGGSSDGDRLSALESIVGNLADSFSALTDAISNGVEAESKPQKKPWTHWGSK